MKRKHLKIENPCKEKWENMKPNESGSFCSSCSKNVIDFTRLNQLEISKKLKKSNGNICARLTKQQLETPLYDFNAPKEFSLPYSNIAVGLMIATTLASCQNLPPKSLKAQTEFVQTTGSILKPEAKSNKSNPNKIEPNNFCTLKGKITAENGNPIENAKITFFTIKKTLIAYSLKDGSFALELPTELIDNNNVIRVSYNEVKKPKKTEMFWGYETSDHVLSKEEMALNYKIKATPNELILGGIGYYSDENKPIVINNGKEITFKDFVSAQQGKNSSCNLENKEYYHFVSEFAIAIYGEKAKYGLYILIDKE